MAFRLLPCLKLLGGAGRRLQWVQIIVRHCRKKGSLKVKVNSLKKRSPFQAAGRTTTET